MELKLTVVICLYRGASVREVAAYAGVPERSVRRWRADWVPDWRERWKEEALEAWERDGELLASRDSLRRWGRE